MVQFSSRSHSTTTFALSLVGPIQGDIDVNEPRFFGPVATMVLIFDLDEESHDTPHASFATLKHQLHGLHNESRREIDVAEERPNPNLNGFSAILCCYP